MELFFFASGSIKIRLLGMSFRHKICIYKRKQD
jgi:hypothetical protein